MIRKPPDLLSADPSLEIEMNETTVILLIVGAYFLPLLIAVLRGVPNTGSVFVINLFFGWTLIGWVVSLAMALRSKSPVAYVQYR